MSNNARDEQFRRWAIAVWEKLQCAHDSNEYTPYSTILANAGYDLVEHTINEAHTILDGNCVDRHEHITVYDVLSTIPDMPTLPEEK